MAEWRGRIEAGEGLIPDRIVAALKADIDSGRVGFNTRLPPHRKLAELLGVGVGAVTRAYAEAEARGLITAHVGRGSFIADPANRLTAREADSGLIDLGRNLPPTAEPDAGFAETLGRLRRRGDLKDHLDYPPPAGFAAHRRAGAAWLSRITTDFPLDWRRLIVTGGAQQAVAISLGSVCRPGDALIVEDQTFSGVKALAAHMNYRLIGVSMDAEGLTPEALEQAAAKGARVAYLQPLQNPTARIMSLERRRAIVAVARRLDLMLVEDDLYGCYANDLGLPPLAALAPERVFYVSGLSKSLSPGLRIGYCVPPEAGGWMDGCLSALRAIAFGAPGFGGIIAAQWIEDGTADAMLATHRAAMTRRADLAAEILGPGVTRPANRAATHFWLPMSELEAERCAARALRGGVQVSPPDAGRIDGSRDYGLRICMGAASSLTRLEDGLRVVVAAMAGERERSLGVV